MACSIRVDVVKNIEVKGKRVGDYFYDKDTDTLTYSLKYPFKVAFSVKGLEYICVTPAFMRLPTFMKWHNIDWLKQQLTQIKCIKENSVLLHGAAWKRNGKGYLAVGFSNSGKTTRVLQEIYLGAILCTDENLIITEDKMMLPVYRKSAISLYHINKFNLPVSLKQKISLFIQTGLANICPMFDPDIWIDLKKDERYSFKMDELIYLTQPKCKEPLAMLTDHEFPFYTNPLIQTYAYATGFDLDDIYLKYRNILRRIAE